MSLEPALAALGMPIPGAPLARATRSMAVAAAPPYLVNHSIRSFAWAVALAATDRVEFDPEILYVAALLHDIGLVRSFDRGGCFEIDGGAIAKEVAQSSGASPAAADAIADAIIRHMAPDLPVRVESRLLWDSTGVDVSGSRLSDVPADLVNAVVAAYPRLNFKLEFAHAFEDQAQRKPRCRAAEMVRHGMLDRIAAAPFDE